MVPGVSIRVPEELMDRLEPFKDKIYVSRMCREALERRAISCESAAQHEGNGVYMGAMVSSEGRQTSEDFILNKSATPTSLWQAMAGLNVPHLSDDTSA